MEYAETATVNGALMFGNYRLEAEDNTARNQFGYELGMTWKEVAQIGAPIWVEKNGIVWCDPERHPERFVEAMITADEMYRRIVVEPEPMSTEECEKIAAFWNAHIPKNQAIVVAEGRLCIVVCR